LGAYANTHNIIILKVITLVVAVGSVCDAIAIQRRMDQLNI